MPVYDIIVLVLRANCESTLFAKCAAPFWWG